MTRTLTRHGARGYCPAGAARLRLARWTRGTSLGGGGVTSAAGAAGSVARKLQPGRGGTSSPPKSEAEPPSRCGRPLSPSRHTGRPTMACEARGATCARGRQGVTGPAGRAAAAWRSRWAGGGTGGGAGLVQAAHVL
eukprot:scaffold2234_cov66-Phaeocystis_antarctica.AAC.9